MSEQAVQKKFEKEIDDLQDACPDHDQHLCHIVNLRNMKTAALLAKDAQYFCSVCGRAAKEDKNICQPVKI